MAIVLYPPSLLEHHRLSRECMRYRITEEPQTPIKALHYQTVKLAALRNHGYAYNIYSQTRTMSWNAVKIGLKCSTRSLSTPCWSLPGEAFTGVFFLLTTQPVRERSIEVLLEQCAHASRECRRVRPVAGTAKLDRIDEGEHVGSEERVDVGISVGPPVPAPVVIVGRGRADDALDGDAEVCAALKEPQEDLFAVRAVVAAAAAEEVQDAEPGEVWCGGVVCARERGDDVDGAVDV